MKLENNYIRLSFNKIGAELKSIYSKETNKEVMYSGEDVWWNRTSPLLFPFVGKSLDGKFIYDQKEYEIGQHGFIRDKEFTIDDVSSDYIWFKYRSTEEDLSLYPFRFELRVGYIISWATVDVKYEIKNLDDKTMYYTIGAHPSFLFNRGDFITFETNNDVNHIYNLEKGFISSKEEIELKRIDLDNDTFSVDTFIYDGIKSCTLSNVNQGTSVKVTFEDFNYLAIWAPYRDGEIAPFVCLEPWAGLPDHINSDYDLKTRFTVSELAANTENAYSYTIEIA